MGGDLDSAVDGRRMENFHVSVFVFVFGVM